jgi:macrolide transport system ATP-binding/permease protein
VSAIVSARDLGAVYGSRRVLDGVTLIASPGQRIGLIGENGVGKSTLLRLLAGELEPDGGEVTRPPDAGFLRQEFPHPGHATLGEVVDEALAGIRAAQHRLDTLAAHLQDHPDDAEALAGYGETLQWAADHDLWDAPRRADLVLAGLGLAGAGRDRRLGTLSGGERSRLGLAALLIRQPRALLLDEPTNHLDDDAVGFVEAHLARLPGTVVLASHDRVFLDAVCTDIVDLDPARAGITRYGGAYSDYLRAKRTERARWEEQYAAEQEERAALRRAVATTARQVSHNRPPRDRDKAGYDYHGGRVQTQVSRRVRNARRRLDELDRTQVRKPPAPLQFRALASGTGKQGRALASGTGKQGRALASGTGKQFRALASGTGNGSDDGVAVSLRGVRIPGRLDIDHLDLPAAGRLLVVGPNGAGKSTLLAVLAGRLVPPAGTVQHRRGLRIGLLEQDVHFANPARTARQIYDTAAPRSGVPLTDLGLVAPRDLDRPVGALSVGQRRRLGLALLVADAPGLMLLDEPTNHISLTLAEELEEALQVAPGAVVAASHDRWLRRRWTGPLLAVSADHRAAGSVLR